MLLEYVPDENRGFKNIIFRDSPTLENSSRGFIDMTEVDKAEATGRITVDLPEKYYTEVFSLACSTAKEYMAENKLDSSALKLAGPQIYDGFSPKLAESAGINDSSIQDLYKEYGDPHSSSLTMAYHLANSKGLYKSGDKILFVAAGSGITTACTLYNY
jgi:3-oxoacyl-[acyl-carrier-protein] synthase-3